MNATKPVHETDADLQRALALHQRGELDNARHAYLAILEKAPRHANALHLLGVVVKQQGDNAQAIKWIEQAIAIDPRQATMHCNLGAAWQALGEPARALESYNAALTLTPAYPLAWSNRGNSLRSLGNFNDACASYQQALALRPVYPEALCNLAIALHDLGDDEQALAAASGALAQRPGYIDAFCAAGNALHGLQGYAQAAEQFGRALALDDRHAQAWCWRGIALQKMHDYDGAVEHYEQAIALRPDFADAFHFMGNALLALNRHEEALAAWRTALALGGDAETLKFAIAAHEGGAPPAAAPAAYVTALFDDYAGRFEQHLVGTLEYSTPALIGAALDALALPGDLDTLDLGCGTGLCAPVLRARSRTLTGVDLSSKMLEQARARNAYDVLACADIGAWLTECVDSFDLVVAADVLVYFGDLGPLMGQVSARLRPGGCFACSVETHGGAGFVLQTSSRYAHAQHYMEEVTRAAGLHVHATEPAVLRRDRGEAVHGAIVLLQKL